MFDEVKDVLVMLILYGVFGDVEIYGYLYMGWIGDGFDDFMGWSISLVLWFRVDRELMFDVD